MAAINKIAANSPSRQQPSELETSLAGALHDLETNTPDLKAALRPLQFVSAREVSTIKLRNCCFCLLRGAGRADFGAQDCKTSICHARAGRRPTGATSPSGGIGRAQMQWMDGLSDSRDDFEGVADVHWSFAC
jgi:hypothetical protein